MTFIKNKKQFFVKVIIVIATIGLILTTFLPFISAIL